MLEECVMLCGVKAKVGRRRAHRALRRKGERRPPRAARGPRGRPVVGIYSAAHGPAVVVPFDPVERDPLRVPPTLDLAARHGQVVRVEVRRAGVGERGTARVLEIIGDASVPGTDVRLIARKYGLHEEFQPGTRAAAEQLPARIDPATVSTRVAFDDPAPVTIDPESARDFDDAIAVSPRRGGGYRLFVHVADVSHFVTPGSPVDVEARLRATSVYFPDRVLPMLPERLSDDLCSLRPGVPRLVHTVVLDFDRDGVPQHARFADGLIRSAARLTYEEVDQVLAGAPHRDMPKPVVAMLARADALRERLEGRRRVRGSIDFDLPEPRIVFDEAGNVSGVTLTPRTRAHQLVEECMLAANEAVAEFLERTTGACLYRIHERPDPEKIEALAEFADALGIDWRPDPDVLAPRDVQALLARVAGLPLERVVGAVALRSMKQARYSAANIGHFGLAAQTYCHFTSPIRRYPDLVVHRLLRAARATKGRAAKGRRTDPGEDLDALALDCSRLERNAEAAERDLLSWKKVAAIASRAGEEFTGIVTGVAPFGLFVSLEENLVEGLLRTERLGAEAFEHDARIHALRGTRSGTVFRLGDRIEVRVTRVDPIARRVELAGTDDTTPARPEARRPRGTRQSWPRGRPRGRR
jgi:ribonuclease R